MEKEGPMRGLPTSDPAVQAQQSMRSQVPNATTGLGPSSAKASRTHKPPARFDDYICHGVRAHQPISLAHRLQQESSGTPYPIANMSLALISLILIKIF